MEEDSLLAGAAAPALKKKGKTGKAAALLVVLLGAVVLGAVVVAKSSSPTTSSTAASLSAAQSSIELRKSVKYGDLSNAETEALFDSFIAKYKKPYATDLTEKASRFLTFKTNLVAIDKYNKDNPRAVFGVTERADWTDLERTHVRGLASSALSRADDSKSSWQYMQEAYPDQEAIALGLRGPTEVEMTTKQNRLKDVQQKPWGAASENKDSVDGTKMETGSKGWLIGEDCQACTMYESFGDYTMDNLPDSFDWRDLGAVSGVTNQKYCGSCWAFSTAQDIEGTRFLATGELIPLSEQQQVACNVDCDGCDGGWPFRAMQYVSKTGGMLYESDMPYKGICAWDACDERPGDKDSRTPVCNVDEVTDMLEAHNVSAIEGYQMVAMGADYEEFIRLALVKNGPLSMAFNAVAMDYYEYGITGCSSDTGDIHAGCISHLETCDPLALDHAVLIVGYGTENDIPYWTIKNSWSDDWGEDGYFRMIRGVNQCGIANFVVHSVAANS